MSEPRRVVVVGAGLAGLVVAQTALEAGASVRIIDTERRPGGTTVLSAGWLWTYSGGEDAALASESRAAVSEYLSRHRNFASDLAWLRQRSGPFLGERSAAPTGKKQREPGTLTSGVRIDPARTVQNLSERLQDADALRLGVALVGAEHAQEGGLNLEFEEVAGGLRWREHSDALILAGGGYAGDLRRVAEDAEIYDHACMDSWVLRNSGTSTGATLDIARSLGGARTEPIDGRSYCRLVPTLLPGPGIERLSAREWSTLAPAWTGPGRAVRLVTQVAAAPASLLDADWSGSDAAWWLARAAGSGYLIVPRIEWDRPTAHGPIGVILRKLIERGCDVLEAGTPDGLWERMSASISPEAAAIAERACSDLVLSGPVTALAVQAGITHTLNGLATDPEGRLLDRSRFPVPGVWAAGVDATQPLARAYASGLAWALASGRLTGAASVTD